MSLLVTLYNIDDWKICIYLQLFVKFWGWSNRSMNVPSKLSCYMAYLHSWTTLLFCADVNCSYIGFYCMYLWHNGLACLAVNQMVDDSRLSMCDVTIWSWMSSWVCVCTRYSCIIHRTWKPDNYLENRHICAWISYSLLCVQWIIINQLGVWYETQLLTVKFCEIHYLCSVSVSYVIVCLVSHPGRYI